MFELISLSDFKETAINDAKHKAIQLAQGYATHYISQSLSLELNLAEIYQDPIKRKKSYIQQCESLVTPFLFQSPLMPEYFDRKEFYSIFNDWNANDYVILFCQTLRKLMK